MEDFVGVVYDKNADDFALQLRQELGHRIIASRPAITTQPSRMPVILGKANHNA
jgi:hypothetical protein